MKKFNALLAMVHVLMLILSACSAESTTAAENLIEPTQTATATPQSVTEKPSATAQPTEMPKATRTPQPTYTPTPTEITVVPPDGCNFEGEQVKFSYSPDEAWIASVCLNNNDVYSFNESTYTKISRQDGKLSWYLPFGATIGNRYDKEHGFLYPFHWTHDGYLFLTFNPVYDGWYYKYDGMALLRLDLKTGDVVESIHYSESGYDFTFSPRGDKLAYIQQQNPPLDLVIWDFVSGGVTGINLNKSNQFSGGLAWSGDQSQIAVTVVESGTTHEDDLFSLWLVDVETGGIRLLIPEGLLYYQPMRWLSKDEILLWQHPRDGLEEAMWQININTGELVLFDDMSGD